MAAGGDENSVAVFGIEHDGMHVAVEVLVEQLPILAAVGGFEHVADLQCDVHGLGILGVDGDIAHVRFHSGHRIGNC